MARRKAKKTVKKSSESVIPNPSTQFIDSEVERRIAATQAIRNAEIEHLFTALRLLRSNFNNEQLQTPVFQFFKHNLPNLTVKTCEKDGFFQVEWKDKDGLPSVTQTDERNLHTSLLQRISKAYPDCTAGMPPNVGFEFSSKAVNIDHLGAAGFQFPDPLMEQPSTSQMLGVTETFQTPGANSQRLSIGMTPKTLRLPKHGEMLLSVHGSPLGVYKEDNMEAIRESEEG